MYTQNNTYKYQNIHAIGTTVMIKFGCFDNDYPSHICMLDTEGEFWHLDGDYQRQEATKNDHPVYKKEGYSYLISDWYIFLHSADNENEWYWAITFNLDLAETSDYYLEGICTEGDIVNPALCPSWNMTTYYLDDRDIPFYSYPSINTSEGLCELSDKYICIQSTQSNLAGIGGTYRQYNQYVPYWFRETNDCDSRTGLFIFDDGEFLLLDAYSYYSSWIIAECELHTAYDEQWEWAKYIPNLCTQWQSVENDTLYGDLITDKNFSIGMGTKCYAQECIDTDPPSSFCMDKNTVMHGFLEGEYKQTGVFGPNYTTPEYERTTKLYYDGYYIPVYVWWRGELDGEAWWVISDTNLSQAIIDPDNVAVYAYCQAAVANPVNCGADWQFFFYTKYHTDTSFELTEGMPSCIHTYLYGVCDLNMFCFFCLFLPIKVIVQLVLHQRNMYGLIIYVLDIGITQLGVTVVG